MLCFLVGLALVIGVVAVLTTLMTVIGIPIFRVQEGDWPYVDDLNEVMWYGFFGLAITAGVVIGVIICVEIGCGLLGR